MAPSVQLALPAPVMLDRWSQRLVLLCFFVSGMAGLVYEIIWTRLLALVMGATVYSLTTVLVAFMAGLGLGAWIIAGPLRRHPEWSRLRLYGVFEILIGVWCLFLPAMMRAAEPLFGVIYNRLYGNDPGSLFTYSLAQFGVCLPLMLVPTTLMGATLPILADHIARRPETVGRRVGLVYAINTFGAMAGAAGAGYVFIPLLGFTHTNWLAAGGNFAAGLVAMWLAGRERGGANEPASEAVDAAAARLGVAVPLWPVFVIFGVSGLCSMTYQVAWTRVISLIIDSTTYSFTIIVTCFILGLALGSWLLSRMVDREPRPLLLLGLVQVFIGLTAMVTLPILGLLSAWVFFLMIQFHGTWWLMQAIMALVIFGMLLLPTMLMGATFPLVVRLLTLRGARVGTMVGRAYATNAIGTILGAFVAGFVLIPMPGVGMERTLLIATALNTLLGLVAIVSSPELRPARRLVMSAGVAVLWGGAFMVCVPVNEEGERGWDKDIITSSPFFFYEHFFQGSIAMDLDFKGYLESLGPRADYREGPSSTVIIRRQVRPGGERYMIFTGGRPEASDNDIQQNLLMHLGMMLHPDPKTVCVIGMGSGSTARTATFHPSLERLDVVEINSAVAELSRRYFPHVHADLDRVNANVIVADGRNHLALTEERYDVIVSQPSHPHLTGVASLFTRDFFEICRERLEPGGICVIWNFSWRIKPEMFRAYMRSFADVFPASFFVLADGSYTFMVGFNSERPEIDWEAVERQLAACTDPMIVQDITVSTEGTPLLWTSPESILDLLILGPRGVARYAGTGRLNTDDNALLEYQLPRTYNVNDSTYIRQAVRQVRDRLRPRRGEGYDPSRHEWVWEYVRNVPAGVVPSLGSDEMTAVPALP